MQVNDIVLNSEYILTTRSFMKLSNFPRLLACPFLRSFSANAIAPKQDNSCPRITGNNDICFRFEIILMVHSTTFPSLLALFAAHFFQLFCKYNCTVRSDDSCPRLFFSKEKENISWYSLFFPILFQEHHCSSGKPRKLAILL